MHIPFCARKCGYCDFLSAPADPAAQQEYTEALTAEIRARGAALSGYRVQTLFFGGGTPSLLPGQLIGRIAAAVREVFDVSGHAEITIEANPGTFDEEKLRIYRDLGINRLSIGLQSADDRELELLGRIHTYAQFEEGFYKARKAGFDNISVDLMSALPGQTETSWEATLNRVTALGPEHISAYSLIIEEGTPFYERYTGAGASMLPDEDAERRMYYRTRKLLRAAGYCRYEISNYARPGFESRHNSGYWTGAEYLGMGLGASSYMGNTRFRNTRDLKTYLDSSDNPSAMQREFHIQTAQDNMEEFMFLGLRMMKGIHTGEFHSRFGKTIDAVYGDVIARLAGQGLIARDQDRLRLTDYGIDVSNAVLAEFLLDS